MTGCSIIDTTTKGDNDESAGGESELAAPQRLFVSYRTDNDEQVQGHLSRLSSNYDHGKEKSSPDSSRSQVLSCTMSTQLQLTTCITPTSNNHDNFESKKDLYTAVLEEKNARLHERVIELDRSHVNLVVQVEALTAEITYLKAHGDDVQEQGHVVATEESQMCDENNTSAKSGKHQIQVENTKFSRELSILINDFVTSSCFAVKRRFPISCLAKIVVDSILSFQWTHSEVAKFSSHCNAADAWSTLSELLNVLRNMK